MQEQAFFEVTPDSFGQEVALGEGDGIVISIKTNRHWTIETTSDWLLFDSTSGYGNADVFAAVKRGSQESERSCEIIVKADGFEPKVIQINQNIFIPVIITVTLPDVLAIGGTVDVGQAADLIEFSQIELMVASESGAENILDNDDVIMTDGNNYIRVSLPQAKDLKFRDRVMLDLSDATITREESGGFRIDISRDVKSVENDPEWNPTACYIPCSSVPAYEYSLVKVGVCQAQESYVGGPWSNVKMDMTTYEDMDFEVDVDPQAFASGTVPSESGDVVGFVIGGKIRPRSPDDLSLLSAERRTRYSDKTFSIKPIVNIMHIGSAKNTFSNVVQDGVTVMNFTSLDGWSYDGASITMNTSTKISPVIGTGDPWQCCFTTIGWSKGKSYYQYAIPIQEKTYGDLEFGFSQSCGTASALPWTFEITYSIDGENFTPVDAVYCISPNEVNGNNLISQKAAAHENSRYCAEFSIPEDKALKKGDKLYVRALLKSCTNVWSTLTLRMNIGFYLATRARNQEIPMYDNVIASENFDNCNVGISPVIGAPLDYLTYCTTNTAYTSRNGWTAVGGRACRRCFLLNSGTPAIYSPELGRLSGMSDVTLTFKACLYTDKYRNNSTTASRQLNKIDVKVTGGGSVGEILWDTDPESDYYNWHTATVKISNATPESVISINAATIANKGAAYIKDVLILK